MEHLSDDRLLALTPAEPAAFAVFYRRHERPVLAFLRHRTGDAELAADLAAETFAAALVGARRFRPGREPALAWRSGSRATSGSTHAAAARSRIARAAA